MERDVGGGHERKGEEEEEQQEEARKDVKQSNDEMHFPLYVVPGARPEGNVERNVKNWEEE